jgi:hypothetical protein
MRSFWDRVLEVNFKGALRLTHGVLPGMLERGWGRIINIGSDWPDAVGVRRPNDGLGDERDGDRDEGDGVIVHGSEELKASTRPRVVSGDLHVCFGVTEPDAGLDTTRIMFLTDLDRGLNPERILIALAALGLGRAAVRRAVAYGAPISQEMILNYVGEHVLGMPRSY